MNKAEWNESLQSMMPEIIAWRRELHRHPEISGQEKQTKAFVQQSLNAMGIRTVQFEQCHAVMGVLENGEGPCIAIRADMDALPVTENTGLSFASENPGVMHACGHDVHMAIALGSALWLSTHKDEWQGTVKWLFEPQQETTGGGKMMVTQGCMEKPQVQCVIGQHVNPNYPAGVFFSRSGPVSGSSDELYLTVKGTGCHGAYPQNGIDAIVVCSQVITAIQTLVSRNLSPFEPAVVTFGTIHGGTANNIVADTVKLTGTLRTLNEETRTFIQNRLKQVCESVAAGMGGSAEVEIRPSYGAVTNDPAYYQMIESAAKQICPQVITRDAPSLGVESFCYFEDHTPGVYYDLGSGESTALHSSTIMIDEDVIQTGVALQCEFVLQLMRK